MDFKGLMPGLSEINRNWRISLSHTIRTTQHLVSRVFNAPRIRTIFLASFVLMMHGSVQAQPYSDSSVVTILTRAYAMLKVHSPDAVKYFERAVALDSTNGATRRQLGYIYHSQLKYDGALEQFRAAEALRPSDTTRLQIGYELESLQRWAEADSIFRLLDSSPYPDIRAQAKDQLATSGPSSTLSSAGSRWWTQFYFAAYYDTRWSTTFFQSHLSRGYHLTDDAKIDAYGTIMYSGDARSTGGQAPEIFSDDAIIFGVGLRVKPLTGLSVIAQEGVAFNLIDRVSRSTAEEDFRIVGSYFYGSYAPYTYHPEPRLPMYPFGDLDASLGAYSRYGNSIGYLSFRGGLRVIEVSHSLVDVYARLSFARDATVRGGIFNSSNYIGADQFYNNVNELGAAVRLIPDNNLGIYVILEFLRGQYANESLLPANHDRYYNSTRLFFIYDTAF